MGRAGRKPKTALLAHLPPGTICGLLLAASGLGLPLPCPALLGWWDDDFSLGDERNGRKCIPRRPRPPLFKFCGCENKQNVARRNANFLQITIMAQNEEHRNRNRNRNRKLRNVRTTNKVRYGLSCGIRYHTLPPGSGPYFHHSPYLASEQAGKVEG
jgi:hypothetical protein